MSKKIKLIWDFRGPSALQTAEHHAIHLNEYLNLENYVLQLTGFESIDEFSDEFPDTMIVNGVWFSKVVSSSSFLLIM
nr:hypothetical protein [uncultured Flavobacterium sp.]